MTPRMTLPTIALLRPALAALALATLGPGAAAQPLGLGPPPACQCSAPTALPALSMVVVHCLCGGVACVVAQHAPLGGGVGLSTQLQCVR
jgi:hypothetical protein